MEQFFPGSYSREIGHGDLAPFWPWSRGVAGGSSDLVLYFKLLIYIYFLIFFSATPCYPHDHGWQRACDPWMFVPIAMETEASYVALPSQLTIRKSPISRGI